MGEFQQAGTPKESQLCHSRALCVMLTPSKQHGGRNTSNGKWHGPFSSLIEADVHAKSTGQQIVHSCSSLPLIHSPFLSRTGMCGNIAIKRWLNLCSDPAQFSIQCFRLVMKPVIVNGFRKTGMRDS